MPIAAKLVAIIGNILEKESGLLEPLTDIGQATINILAFNHPDRIIERGILLRLGLMKT